MPTCNLEAITLSPGESKFIKRVDNVKPFLLLGQIKFLGLEAFDPLNGLPHVLRLVGFPAARFFLSKVGKQNVVTFGNNLAAKRRHIRQ